ncbi:6146_t:CDS:1, partial [Dentiscutata heterogama]
MAFLQGIILFSLDNFHIQEVIQLAKYPIRDWNNLEAMNKA